ncbi:MAG: hypothetical protein IJA10_00610 [Lachnospiraceae bacterium]|nr:hypothetical protein [Lachnospiraceae bacterium]
MKQNSKSMWKDEEGAITIFSALIFLVLLVFFFALIEGIYINTAKSRMKRSLESGMTSILADYNIPLWERYGILAVDKNYGQSSDGYFNVRLEGFTEDQFLGNGSYGDSEVTTMVTSVKTLTQEELYGLQLQIDEQGKKDKKENMLGMAFETPKSQGDYSDVSKEYSAEDQVEGTIDPRESLRELLQNGILNIVVENPEELSNLELDPEKITVNTGSIPKIDIFQEETFPDIMSMDFSNIKNHTGNAVAYAMEHFGWYGQEKEGKTGLKYEIEYLLEKKESDKANLEAVANDLIGIRYGFNLAYVLGNAELCAQAESIAVALTAEGGPLAIKAAKYGILCSLAYAESVSDVKALLSGGKVPLTKTKETFRLRIENIAEDSTGGSYKEGFDYSQYLMMLCVIRWSGGVDYSAIAELMEYNLRLEYDNFRLENCIYGFSAQAELDLDRKYNAFEIGGEDLYHLFTYYQVEY